MKRLIMLQRHPNHRLRTAWSLAQLGLLIFPLIPLIGAVGIFLALIGTWWQQHDKIVRRPLNWGLAIVAIWLVITVGFANDRTEAFLGLFNFLPFFIFFAAFSTLIQNVAQLRQLANILVITSVPVVVIGLGQLFLGWSTPVELQAIFGWVVLAGGNPPGRMASVLIYANILAGYLVIVFTLSLGLWIENYQNVKSRFLSVAVMGNLVALILTNSRNAWAIALCVCLAFAVYQGWRWLVAIVGAIALTVLGAAFAPSPLQQWLRQIVPAYFWARLTDQLYPDRPFALMRTTQWRFAWDLTWQRPLTGWGLRNFNPLYEAQMHLWLGHPHNFLLMLTAETGIPGAVLFCGWVSWVIGKAIQVLLNCSEQRQILFSYLVAFLACVVFNTVDVSIFDLRLNTLGWLLLAAISGVSQSHSNRALKCLK